MVSFPAAHGCRRQGARRRLGAGGEVQHAARGLIDEGFDAELYKWVVDWVRKDWPFRKVAYPGRSIDWATWDSMVAANRPAKAVAGE